MKKSIPFLLFLVSFGVYLKTLCPTVYVGDSGELIAAAYTLGIAHPPGYPLYCLLGKLFTFLPFGSIAYRINLMSAFFASLTVVLVYLIILKILTNGPTGQRVNGSTGKLANWQTGKPFARHIPAISSSLLFAFSSTFWSQAVVAEVYTLNTFFLALSIFVLLKWREALPTPNSRSEAETPTPPLHARRSKLSERSGDPDPSSPRSSGQTPNSTRYLYSFSLIYGLGLTNHYIMGLFAPAFILFILWTRPKIIKEVKTLFLMLGLFLLPLMLYLYLPIRSLQNPPIDWGNPENLPNFLAHMGRIQYRKLEFGQVIGFKTQTLFIRNFFRQLAEQFTIYVGWIGIVGLFWGLYRNKKLFVTTFLVFLFTSLGLIFLLHFPYEPRDIFRMSVYYLPSYLIFSLWIGYGIEYLIFKGAQLNRGVKIGFGTRNSYKCLSTILILALPLLPLSKNYFKNDRSRHYFAYDFGMNILKTLEEGAVLFVSGEKRTFPLAYLHMVEGKRSDVAIYDGPGNVFKDPYERDRGLNREEWRKRRTDREWELVRTTPRPVYYSFLRNIEIPGYILRPTGIVYCLGKEGIESKEEYNYWKDYQMRGIENEEIYKDLPTRAIIAEYYYRLGKYYERLGKREKALETYLKLSEVGWLSEEFHYGLGVTFHELGMYEYAILEYQRAIEIRPTDVKAYNNLGVCYALKGQYQKAKREWEKALSINPGYEEARKNLERLKSREQGL